MKSGFYTLLLLLAWACLVQAQVPTTLQKTLLYEDTTSTSRLFSQPLIDSKGNLIVVATQFAGCNGTCGVTAYSISPSGTANWITPSSGYLALAVNQMVLDRNDTLYFQGYWVLGQVYGVNSGGVPLAGWPVNLGYPLDTQLDSNLLIDPSDNSILVKGGTQSSSDLFPGRIAAFNGDGSIKWQTDFANAPNNTPGMVIGPNGDIYTYSDHAIILRHNSGEVVCTSMLATALSVGGPEGVFALSSNQQIVEINPDCTTRPLFTPSLGLVGLLAYDAGIIFGINYPVSPADNLHFYPIGVRIDGTLAWKNSSLSIPSGSISTKKNGRVYIIGIDTVDGNQKLFVLDEQTGLIVDAFDTTGTCAACGVAVGPNGTIYINDLSSTRIWSLTSLMLPPTVVSVSPTLLSQGQVVQNFVITGANFDSTSTVAFGSPGIVVNSHSVHTPEEISATVAVSANAEVGFSDVLVTSQHNQTATLKNAVAVVPSASVFKPPFDRRLGCDSTEKATGSADASTNSKAVTGDLRLNIRATRVGNVIGRVGLGASYKSSFTGSVLVRAVVLIQPHSFDLLTILTLPDAPQVESVSIVSGAFIRDNTNLANINFFRKATLPSGVIGIPFLPSTDTKTYPLEALVVELPMSVQKGATVALCSGIVSQAVAVGPFKSLDIAEGVYHGQLLSITVTPTALAPTH